MELCDKFQQNLIGDGFKSTNRDMCVYSRIIEESCMKISLYIDDMLIIRLDLYCVEDTKRFFSSIFNMKDLKVAEVILGITIIRDDDGIVISQSNYIEKVLRRFNIFVFDLVVTSVNSNLRLMEN